MTYKELLNKLTTYEGPCMRLCSYCPEDYNTAEVKECVEELVREIYNVKQCNSDLMKELIKVRAAYRKETGKEYPMNVECEVYAD